jgi:hypothetical protein
MMWNMQAWVVKIRQTQIPLVNVKKSARTTYIPPWFIPCAANSQNRGRRRQSSQSDQIVPRKNPHETNRDPESCGNQGRACLGFRVVHRLQSIQTPLFFHDLLVGTLDLRFSTLSTSLEQGSDEMRNETMTKPSF